MKTLSHIIHLLYVIMLFGIVAEGAWLLFKGFPIQGAIMQLIGMFFIADVRGNLKYGL